MEKSEPKTNAAVSANAARISGAEACQMRSPLWSERRPHQIMIAEANPNGEQELVDLLARATEIVRRATGFISANLHRSVDGSKVTMYAQWRSIEDYEAMRSNPAPLPYLQQALTFARFEPAMYEVVETYSALANGE